MSNGINSSQGWSLLKNLVADLGGKTEVTNSDVQKILKNADANKDDVVTKDEFILYFEKSELYQSDEEKYLEAYKVISMLDGDVNSMSLEDITSSLEAYENMNSSAADAAGGAGGAGGTGGADNTTSKTSPTSPTTPIDTSTDTTSPAVSELGDLQSETLQVLNSERTDKINELSVAKQDKTIALAQQTAQVDSTKAAYDQACIAFSDMVEAQMKNNENLKELGQNVLDLQDEKDALNADISAQNDMVTAAEAAVTSLSSAVSSLVAPPQKITVCTGKDDKGNPVYEQQDNPEYQTYLEQKAELEAQLAAAQQKVEEQEAVLVDMEASYTEIEGAYSDAVEAYSKEAEKNPEIKQQVIEAQNNVNQTQIDYDTAQTEKTSAAAEFDANIEKLATQVNEYDRVIAQKELEEQNITLPEGYAVDEDGNITNGENNLSVQDSLPEGYKLTDDGKILDADGKDVGVVSGSTDSKKYLIQEEIEPEPLSWRETYKIANDLFDNPNADWDSALEGLSDKDIKAIKNQYDDRAEKVNAETQALEGNLDDSNTAYSFEVNAKEKLSEENDKLLNEITQALSDKTFADSIDLNNVEILSSEELAKMSEDELKEYYDKINGQIIDNNSDNLNTFINEKCGFSVDDIPSDGLTPELREIIGEDTIARKEGESEEDYKIRITGYLNQVFATDSTIDHDLGVFPHLFSAEEQMAMLNALKNYGGAEAAKIITENFDPSELYSTAEIDNAEELEKAAYEDGKVSEETVDLFTDILKLNSELYGPENATDYLSDVSSDELVCILESAKDNGNLDEILQYIDVPALANEIQWYAGDNETNWMTRLMEVVAGDSLDGTYNEDNFDPEHDLTQYKESITKTIDAYEAGDINEDEARYLLSEFYSTPAALIGAFRGMTIGHQQNYLEPLFKLYENSYTAATSGAVAAAEAGAETATQTTTDDAAILQEPTLPSPQALAYSDKIATDKLSESTDNFGGLAKLDGETDEHYALRMGTMIESSLQRSLNADSQFLLDLDNVDYKYLTNSEVEGIISSLNYFAEQGGDAAMTAMQRYFQNSDQNQGYMILTAALGTVANPPYSDEYKDNVVGLCSQILEQNNDLGIEDPFTMDYLLDDIETVYGVDLTPAHS